MKRKIAALDKVDADLTNLQHKIKRDPLSYEQDFANQYATYQNQREILLQAPSTHIDTDLVSLRDLIDFVAHVAECYSHQTKTFAAELIELILDHHSVLESDLREKIVGSLVLLRRKNIIDSTTLLNTLFPILVTTPSKALRAYLFQCILSDVRNANAAATNHKLNRAVQKVLNDLLTSDKATVKGIWAVKLTRELWRRQIWTDAKAVEIMRLAALADHEKVIMGGVRFFLGGDKGREELEDESSDEENVDLGKLKHQMLINKKNKKRVKALNSAVASVRRKEKRKKQPALLNFSAFHLLHDPQTFAEDLFQKHLQSSRSKLNLERKLQVLQLVSRLVGLHKLTVLQLYSYFLKYLTPRQPSVTSFLASLAQATHSLVPPDVLEPLITKIANQFVSEASAGEVASAGLNAIREICVRQPLAMNDTLLQDLVMYRKSKDKGTMMAAKGLLSLYRQLGPELLRRRDRGKDVAFGLRSGTIKKQRYGEEPTGGGIEGLDLLERFKAEERARRRNQETESGGEHDQNRDPDGALAEGDLRSDQDGVHEESLEECSDEDRDEDEDEELAGWEIDKSESDDSGGWINVESDKEVDVSDLEDGKRARRKNQKRSAQQTASPEDGETDDQTPISKATTNIGSDDISTKDNDLSEPSEGTKQATVTNTSFSNLATQRILTPADLAKLNELRLAASIDTHLPASQRNRQKGQTADYTISMGQRYHADDPLTAAEIEGLASLSHKTTKAEKIARAKDDQADRRSHKSTQAMRREKKAAEGKSTTNREKARKKNFMMTLGKAKRKDKRSLTERSRVLKAHVARSKRGGKRGNVGR